VLGQPITIRSTTADRRASSADVTPVSSGNARISLATTGDQVVQVGWGDLCLEQSHLLRPMSGEGLLLVASEASSDDPTLDLRLPPRVEDGTRPVTSDERDLLPLTSVTRGWGTSMKPAAVALTEGGAWPGENAAVSIVDLLNRTSDDLLQVRIAGCGGRRDRHLTLTQWGSTVVRRRAHTMVKQGAGSEARLTYGGERGPARAGSSVGMALRSVFTRAGLGAESDLAPKSLVLRAALDRWDPERQNHRRGGEPARRRSGPGRGGRSLPVGRHRGLGRDLGRGGAVSYTTYDLVVATATSPLFAQLAAHLPAQNGWSRPRHPDSDLTALVYGACRRLFQSYSRLDCELAQQWPSLRAACLAEGVDLGEKPMTYHRWEGHATVPSATSTLGSLELAKAQGKLDPSAGSISRPHRTQLVYRDGTHLRGKFRAHHGEWGDPVLGTCTAEYDLTRSTKTPTRLLVKEGARWVAYHPESRKRRGLARIDEDAHVLDKYETLVERGQRPGHESPRARSGDVARARRPAALAHHAGDWSPGGRSGGGRGTAGAAAAQGTRRRGTARLRLRQIYAR
jgi:hypothetical protein